jgi:trans-aconitate methyltransferase
MQLTRFDRWLREKYVYQTQIRTLRPPESLPTGIKSVKVPDVPGKRYKYLYVANRTEAADQFITNLKETGQMYTTQVVDRKCWYVPFIAPKTRSVTWWVISTVFTLTSACIILVWLSGLAGDPEFRKNLADSFNLLGK